MRRTEKSYHYMGAFLILLAFLSLLWANAHANDHHKESTDSFTPAIFNMGFFKFDARWKEEDINTKGQYVHLRNGDTIEVCLNKNVGDQVLARYDNHLIYIPKKFVVQKNNRENWVYTSRYKSFKNSPIAHHSKWLIIAAVAIGVILLFRISSKINKVKHLGETFEGIDKYLFVIAFCFLSIYYLGFQGNTAWFCSTKLCGNGIWGWSCATLVVFIAGLGLGGLTISAETIMYDDEVKGTEYLALGLFIIPIYVFAKAISMWWFSDYSKYVTFVFLGLQLLIVILCLISYIKKNVKSVKCLLTLIGYCIIVPILVITYSTNLILAFIALNAFVLSVTKSTKNEGYCKDCITYYGRSGYCSYHKLEVNKYSSCEKFIHRK